MQMLYQFKTCHRLDKATSGLVLVSKTITCRDLINKMFQNKEIVKSYYAICKGKNVIDEGFWEQLIDNKESKSKYKVLKTTKTVTDDYLFLMEFNTYQDHTYPLRLTSLIQISTIMDTSIDGFSDKFNSRTGLFLYYDSF